MLTAQARLRRVVRMSSEGTHTMMIEAKHRESSCAFPTKNFYLSAMDSKNTRRTCSRLDSSCGHQDRFAAVGLEAADAGSMARARVDNDEGTLRLVDLDALRRRDPSQHIVHRTRKLAAVHDELRTEFQHVRREFGCVLLVLLASLLHDVEE